MFASVNKIFSGSFLTFGFLAAAGCSAIIGLSGCGEVVVTPEEVVNTENAAVKDSGDSQPKETQPTASQPKDDDGGYDEMFLWKPASDSNRKLVILTPYQMTFKSLTLTTAAGQTENGNDTGRSNGHRQTWRFSLPGDQYGRQVTVTGHDGPEKVWTVPDGAQRYTSK